MGQSDIQVCVVYRVLEKIATQYKEPGGEIFPSDFVSWVFNDFLFQLVLCRLEERGRGRHSRYRRNRSHPCEHRQLVWSDQCDEFRSCVDYLIRVTDMW